MSEFIITILVASRGLVASPIIQSSTNRTRPAMYYDADKVYMTLVYNLMLSPSGNKGEVSSTNVVLSQLRLEAFTHYKGARSGDCVHDCIYRALHCILVFTYKQLTPVPRVAD